jgi:hypothetical protein
MRTDGSYLIYLYMQCSKWAGICRYTIPELLFVPEFHTGTYQYILYQCIFFHFSDGISLLHLKGLYRHF